MDSIIGTIIHLLLSFVSIICMLAIMIFPILILIFGVMEGTVQLQPDQKRSFKKTIIALVGFGISLLLLVLILIGYAITSTVLTTVGGI